MAALEEKCPCPSFPLPAPSSSKDHVIPAWSQTEGLQGEVKGQTQTRTWESGPAWQQALQGSLWPTVQEALQRTLAPPSLPSSGQPLQGALPESSLHFTAQTGEEPGTSSVLGTVLPPEGSEADEKRLCPQSAHSLARKGHILNTSGRVASGSCFP